MSPSTAGVRAPLPRAARKRKSFASDKADCPSDGEFSDNDSPSPKSVSPQMEEDRRAHHNELERRRRDHIKDHFVALKDAIPLLEGEKSSRALILKRAVEYITVMQKRIAKDQDDIEELKKRNEQLETQVKLLDQPRVAGAADESGTVVAQANTQPTNIAPRFSGSGCVAGPSMSSHLLPTIAIPAVTVNSSLAPELHPERKITAFTPVTQSSLLPSTEPFCESLFRSLPNQFVSSMILGSTPFKPLAQSMTPEFDYNIHSRILANSQLATAAAHY